MTNNNKQEILIKKARKSLMEYLRSESAMSAETQRKLFTVIGCEFKNKMQDKAFYNKVDAFCNKRRSQAEKNAFYYEVMTELAKDNNIAKAYAAKYPNEYRIKKGA